MPLYNIQDPTADAIGSANSAMQGFGALQGMQAPAKTLGGALMSAGSGALTGASLGGMLTTAGAVHPGFAIAGAALSAVSYFLG